jgi:hypothetical protein
MKRISIILIMLHVVLLLHAQQGLPINKLFQGQVIPQERMMETKVRGKMIAKYQLSYFHSVRFNATPNETHLIMTLVDMGDPAKGDMQERSTMSTNTTETLMVRLDSQGKLNRYLCAKVNKKNQKKNEMVVIYMEGTLSSLEKMKEILK